MNFDENYYIRGAEKGVSNYTNYRWMPEATIPMAMMAKKVVGIDNGDTLLDFGAARGYFVKAMRSIGVTAYGFDISKWAVENAHPDVKDYITDNTSHLLDVYDHVWSKDVLEHIPTEDLLPIIHDLFKRARKSVFIIVPLTEEFGGRYISPNDEKDITHVQRLPMREWLQRIQSVAPPNWSVWGSYKIPVLKQASELYPNSTGFISCKPLQ